MNVSKEIIRASQPICEVKEEPASETNAPPAKMQVDGSAGDTIAAKQEERRKREAHEASPLVSPS